MFASIVLSVLLADPTIDPSSFKQPSKIYGDVAVKPAERGYDISAILARDGKKVAVEFAVKNNHRHLVVKSNVANIAAIPISLFADECDKHGVTFAVEYVVDTSVQWAAWSDNACDYRERQLFLYSQIVLRDRKNCTGIVIRASHPIDPKDTKSHAAEQFRRVIENCKKANQPAGQTEGGGERDNRLRILEHSPLP